MVEKTQNQEETITGSIILRRALQTGFIGGVFWGLMGKVMHYFNFTEISAKAYVLHSWTRSTWTFRWYSEIIVLLIIGVISMVVAILYYAVLKKVNSLWVGMIYGGILWALIMLVVTPFYTMIPNLKELELKTIISTLSLFSLYGLFIGYSISYDYAMFQKYNLQNKGDEPSEYTI